MTSPTLPRRLRQAVRGLPTTQDADVVAMRFDDETSAADLAKWCGGEVLPLQTGGVSVMVPTERGPRPALPGDWIVMYRGACFRPHTHADFVAKFHPAEV